MLHELHISNFALIKDITLPFSGKLNVLTGETGAGKSIIIEALNLVLGERADTGDIRTGSKSASVEAVFDIGKNKKLKETLFEFGIETDDNMLILRRNLNQETGSRNFINDKPVTLRVMKKVGDELVDIHGQHEHQNLLKTEKHIDYLDNFLRLTEKRETVSSLFKSLLENKRDLDQRKKRIQELKEKEELYRFQIKEIDEAQLQPREDENLEKRQRILENAEKLIQTIQDSFMVLYENEGSIFEILNKIKAQIESLCDIDSNLNTGKQQLDNILFGIEEIAQSFSSYINKMEYDPDELAINTKRLDYINHLKMKYGRSIEEIIAYRDAKQKEIKELEDVEIKTEEIEKTINDKKKKLVSLTLSLSEEREKRKKDLEERVNQELQELGMGSSKFTVELKRIEEKNGMSFPNEKKYKLGEKGIDRISFQISTNPGEPQMELKKVVSGGELSRIMLALKSILASLDEVHCMIFDEVDAGIGGSVAEEVGDKMKKVSKERQIITITHLHQIASKGDWHIKVEKEEREGRAYTYARILNEKERVDEIARLISGEKLTQTALEHAKTILKLKPKNK